MLDDGTAVILLGKRDVATRTYGEKLERKFTREKGDKIPLLG